MAMALAVLGPAPPPPPPPIPSSFLDAWKAGLASSPSSQASAFPSHHHPDPLALVSSCRPRSLAVGSGLSIFRRILVPALLRARHEILFVTCFWANPSDSLSALSDGLAELAASRAGGSRSGQAQATLRIRIGFSSRSLVQRVLHTFSRDGKVYSSSQWQSVLGLPAPEVLARANIELSVKTLFFNPFGIVHPKFLIVDRRRAWLPSCNVSWECWFEGCVGIEGAAVDGLVRFWKEVWGRGRESWILRDEPWMGGDGGNDDGDDGGDHDDDDGGGDGGGGDGSGGGAAAAAAPSGGVGSSSTWGGGGAGSPARLVRLDGLQIPTMILPSTHHINPRFRFLPFLAPSPAPATPLNSAILALFATAQSAISLLTPNVTSGPVVDGLLEALGRGVDVRIRTSRGMMVSEQIITAGTTSERSIDKLISRYEKMRRPQGTSQGERWRRWRQWWTGLFGRPSRAAEQAGPGRDVEAAAADAAVGLGIGALSIQYYRPAKCRKDAADEPVVSHFKMTLVDDRFLVLGSGNMDRASWYTSQELGILFHDSRGFEPWRAVWDGALLSRMEDFYQSEKQPIVG